MLAVRRILPLLLLLSVALQGCTTLPDVKPFADSTAALASAAGTDYHEISADVQSLKEPSIPGEPDGDFESRNTALQNAQKLFTATDKNLDTLFAAMMEYSEKLASLAAAGKTGSDAAQSLLDSAKGFASLASIAMPVGGAAASTITSGFKAIANQFTQMQAQKSLRQAVDAAQPGVDQVAQQFAVIYGTALNVASSGIRNVRRLQASLDAGPSVIGFHDNVQRNYNDYYRFLNGIVANVGSQKPGLAWQGFCRGGISPCRAREELDAVGLVEARMEAIRPIVDAYQVKIASIDETLEHRRATNAAVVRAVQAWALEHQKLRQSLADGTSLSAFNLRAALIELQGLLSQK